MEIEFLSGKHYIGRYPGTRPPTYLSAPPMKAPANERKNILVIDDDPLFRSLFKVMLQQTGLPLAEIREAEESRTGIALCGEESLDMVFCDLNLPKAWSSNGIEIVYEIRKIRPELPIYMVTAANTADVIAAVRRSGATGHILKPVNLRILKRVLMATFSPPTVRGVAGSAI
jgi:DNA-binding NarL/FixJ family response regulator